MTLSVVGEARRNELKQLHARQVHQHNEAEKQKLLQNSSYALLTIDCPSTHLSVPNAPGAPVRTVGWALSDI